MPWTPGFVVALVCSVLDAQAEDLAPAPVYPYGPVVPVYPYGPVVSAEPLAPVPVAPPPQRERAPAYSRTTLTTLGLGATVFAERSTTGGPANLWRPGVSLELTTRFPVGQRAGFAMRLAWGMTEFQRFTEVTGTGYRLGAWTTRAYKDVSCWATKSDWQPFRAMGGMYAFAALVFPYLAAGGFYLVAPLAMTTYVKLDATGTLDLVEGDEHGLVPYLEGGLGFVGYLHPTSALPLAGVGPTLGAGVRAGRLDASLKGTWLPPYLHGEALDLRTNVMLGSVAVGVVF